MTDSDLTVIQLVLDRSGSMIAIAEDAEGSINAFIQKQREEPGRCQVRITQFDDQVDVVNELTDISEIEEYRVVPRGMTALYDAMGKSIAELGEKLNAMPESDRPAHVIFVTVTDGEENHSVEFKDPDKLKALITEQTDKYKWEFLFLAAGQDAVMTGQRIGIRRDRSMTYAATGQGVASSMNSVSYAASGIRGGAASVSFTDQDREDARGGSQSSSR